MWKAIPGYTRTPSDNQQCSAVGAQIISLRSDDLVVPKLPACGCEWWWRFVSPSTRGDWWATSACHDEYCARYSRLRCDIGVSPLLPPPFTGDGVFRGQQLRCQRFFFNGFRSVQSHHKDSKMPVRFAHLGLSQPSVRTELPSTSTQPTPLTPAHTQPPHALAKHTKEPWLYPPPPLTKERSSVGVHRHRTGWRLAGVPVRSTLQTV